MTGDATTEAPARANRQNPRPDLNFTPVRNGMDYLARAVDDLTQSVAPPSERDLKYAVLHLQAATEVLLKARLVGEHWSLVFKNPGSASLADFAKGNFDSCGIDATMDRLENIAQVVISPKDRSAIKDLADDRNALTHYGYTANAFQVEARAASVLNFLLDFITKHLKPMLHAQHQEMVAASTAKLPDRPSMIAVDQALMSPEVRGARQELNQVSETMDELRMKIGRIHKLVEKRMRDISGELASAEHCTVQCPDCRQWALVVNDDMSWNPIMCHFCLAVYGPDAAAHQYVWRVVGEDNGTVQLCQNCGAAGTLAIGASTAAQKTANLAICFNCADTYEEITDGQ